MDVPMSCDVCDTEIISEDGSAEATVVSDGDILDKESEFFIAVEEASMKDGGLVVEEADVFCEDHIPDEAHEY